MKYFRTFRQNSFNNLETTTRTIVDKTVNTVERLISSPLNGLTKLILNRDNFIYQENNRISQDNIQWTKIFTKKNIDSVIVNPKASLDVERIVENNTAYNERMIDFSEELTAEINKNQESINTVKTSNIIKDLIESINLQSQNNDDTVYVSGWGNVNKERYNNYLSEQNKNDKSTTNKLPYDISKIKIKSFRLLDRKNVILNKKKFELNILKNEKFLNTILKQIKENKLTIGLKEESKLNQTTWKDSLNKNKYLKYLYTDENILKLSEIQINKIINDILSLEEYDKKLRIIRELIDVLELFIRFKQEELLNEKRITMIQQEFNNLLNSRIEEAEIVRTFTDNSYNSHNYIEIMDKCITISNVNEQWLLFDDQHVVQVSKFKKYVENYFFNFSRKLNSWFCINSNLLANTNSIVGNDDLIEYNREIKTRIHAELMNYCLYYDQTDIDIRNRNPNRKNNLVKYVKFTRYDSYEFMIESIEQWRKELLGKAKEFSATSFELFAYLIIYDKSKILNNLINLFEKWYNETSINFEKVRNFKSDFRTDRFLEVTKVNNNSEKFLFNDKFFNKYYNSRKLLIQEISRDHYTRHLKTILVYQGETDIIPVNLKINILNQNIMTPDYLSEFSKYHIKEYFNSKNLAKNFTWLLIFSALTIFTGLWMYNIIMSRFALNKTVVINSIQYIEYINNFYGKDHFFYILVDKIVKSLHNKYNYCNTSKDNFIFSSLIVMLSNKEVDTVSDISYNKSGDRANEYFINYSFTANIFSKQQILIILNTNDYITKDEFYTDVMLINNVLEWCISAYIRFKLNEIDVVTQMMLDIVVLKTFNILPSDIRRMFSYWKRSGKRVLINDELLRTNSNWISSEIFKVLYRQSDQGKFCSGSGHIIFTDYKSYLNIDKSKLKFIDSCVYDEYYKSFEYKFNKRALTEFEESIKPLSYFQKDIDFRIKQELWKVLFNENIDSYDNMMKLEYNSTSTTSDMIRTIIAHEKGRLLGYLPYNERGVEKIFKQIDALQNRKVGISILCRSNLFDNIDTPSVINWEQKYAKTWMSMPLNSSSGYTGRTMAQAFCNVRLEEIPEKLLRIPREWKVTMVVDSGGNYRFIYNRNGLIRLSERLIFSHIYDYFQRHNWTTMSKDQKKVHDMIFSDSDDNYKFLSLDYSLFDTTNSSCDVLKIKIQKGIRGDIYNSIKEIESSDYALIYSKNNQPLLNRADKLMTGDYLTSALGCGMQISTYENWTKKGFDFKVKCLIGDDVVLKIPNNNNKFDKQFFVNEINKLGNVASTEKSYLDNKIAMYNRRIWKKNIYPFNNMFTLVNSIYRSKILPHEYILDNMSDDIFDVYCNCIALEVSLRLAKVDEHKIKSFMLVLAKDIYERTKIDIMQLITVEEVVQHIDINYNRSYASKLVYRYKNEIESWRDLEKLLNLDPSLAIEANIANPYYGLKTRKRVTNISLSSPVLINFVEIKTNYFKDFYNFPYWLRDFAQAKVFKQFDGIVNLYLNCLSKFQLPIELGKNVYIIDRNSLINAVIEYINFLYPETEQSFVQIQNSDFKKSLRYTEMNDFINKNKDEIRKNF